MPFSATPGASNANSYVTLAEADSYFEFRLHSSAWDNADDQEAALISATRMLDWYLKWKGEKATTTQALEWPRANVYDRDDNLLDETIIPQRVKDAACEMALANLSEDRVADKDMDGFAQIVVGPLSLRSDATELRSSAKKVIPEHVRNMLSDFTSISGGVSRLVRG